MSEIAETPQTENTELASAEINTKNNTNTKNTGTSSGSSTKPKNTGSSGSSSTSNDSNDTVTNTTEKEMTNGDTLVEPNLTRDPTKTTVKEETSKNEIKENVAKKTSNKTSENKQKPNKENNQKEEIIKGDEEIDVEENIDEADFTSGILSPHYTLVEDENIEEAVGDNIVDYIVKQIYYETESYIGMANVSKEREKSFVMILARNTPLIPGENSAQDVPLNGNHYAFYISTIEDNYFNDDGNEEPKPNENSKFVTFGNGAHGFTNGTDAIYGEVYGVYIKIVALDGEMSDNDIRDVVNSVNLYAFTREQGLNSYYSNRVDV